jgi:imidazolonepropionase-like amidohydrolase
MILTDIAVEHRVGLDGRDRGPAVIRIGPSGEIASVSDRPEASPGGELRTAIPLLGDAHAHLGLSDGVEESGDFHTLDHVDRQLRDAARLGIGHVHSLGTDQRWLTTRLSQRIRAGEPGERAFGYSAGIGFGAVAGWPPELTFPELRFRPMEPDDARRLVREMAGLGVSTLKIWIDDLGGSVPKIPVAIAESIVEEAREAGITTFAHVKNHVDAEALVALGIDVLAHSVRDRLLSDQLLDAMARSGTTLVPTLSREDAELAFSLPENPYLKSAFFRSVAGPERLAHLRSLRLAFDPDDPGHRLENALENVARAHGHGISVGLGTDAGFRAKLLGFAEHRELELLRRAGLSAEFCLRAGLEVDQRIVATALTDIVPGVPASFFVVHGDPYADISATQNIDQVWLVGKRLTDADRPAPTRSPAPSAPNPSRD